MVPPNPVSPESDWPCKGMWGGGYIGDTLLAISPILAPGASFSQRFCQLRGRS